MNTTKPRSFRPVHLTIATLPWPIPTHRSAFTRTDLLVVVVFAAILLAILRIIPPLLRAQAKHISCLNNLKQIGTAYQIWANDHADQFPFEIPQTNGGWRELAQRADAGGFCWTNYVTMQNELGQCPPVLVCPKDNRTAATNFSDHFNNLNVSYFVGVNASRNSNPQGILSGDRNLGPGPLEATDYGYSPANGQGNDAILTPSAAWTAKMHSEKNTLGCGNILLADGSAQMITTETLRYAWLKDSNTTNHIPVRLIFP
jgi:hypothetical protein